MTECRACTAPAGKTVLRCFGWWTEATLPATVFYFNGTLYGHSIIELPWKHASQRGLIEKRGCFPGARQIYDGHWVGIRLNAAGLCQWCRCHPEVLPAVPTHALIYKATEIEPVPQCEVVPGTLTGHRWRLVRSVCDVLSINAINCPNCQREIRGVYN